MPICPSCNAVNPEGYSECQTCGAPIRENTKAIKRLPPKWQHVKSGEGVILRCRHCFALNPPGNMKCRQCGQDLLQPGAEAASTRPNAGSSLPWGWIVAAAGVAMMALLIYLLVSSPFS